MSETGRILTTLGSLPAGSLLDEPGLAGALDVAGRTIREMVARGELPPPIRVASRNTWLAGRVLSWLNARAELEEKARPLEDSALTSRLTHGRVSA